MGTSRRRILQAALIGSALWTISSGTQARSICAGISNSDARLKCFDDAARAGGAKSKPNSDPVIEKAKAAILAKLKDPGSAQFGPIQRAMRPNMRGEPTDTICGTVNAKNSYGGYIGAMPFVYFVASGTLSMVDAVQTPGDVSAIVWRNMCGTAR
jgi:hypothetical protein